VPCILTGDSFLWTFFMYLPFDAPGVPDDAWVKIHVIVVGGKDRTGNTVFEYREDNNFWFDGPVWTYYICGTTLNPSLVGLMRGLLPDAEPSYQKGRAVLLFSSLFSSCECLDREIVLIQLLSLSAKRTRI